MTKTFRGIYRHGRIEWTGETPPDEQAEVEVTFFDAQQEKPKRPISFGMFAKENGPLSTMEDFIEAKKIWEREDI